jgi:hypothetical protein
MATARSIVVAVGVHGDHPVSLAIIPHLANDNSDKQQASHDHPRRAKGAFDSMFGAEYDTSQENATVPLTEHEVIR